MKKDTKTYLLLALVLAIWGIIGYKVLSPNSSDALEQDSFEKITVKSLSIKEKDTFSILADYRDPFLGTFPKKSIKKKSKPKKAPEPEITVQFTGLMTDNDTKQRIYFITIAGQQYLMNVKDEIEKVQLLSGTSTSIRIRSNGKTRIIELQQ